MRASSGLRKPVIADEVPKVDMLLVLCDKEGTPFTVRYDAVNAMLLNQFLKAHRKNEDKQATIACLEKQVQALTAGLQRMRAQLELNTSAPQTVLNNPYQAEAIVCLEGHLLIIHRTCVALVLSFCSVWLLFLTFAISRGQVGSISAVVAEAHRFEPIDYLARMLDLLDVMFETREQTWAPSFSSAFTKTGVVGNYRRLQANSLRSPDSQAFREPR